MARNLFVGKNGDVFGAVLQNNHRRSRSATSKSSTTTATTMDSAIRFSTRSTGTTAATSLMSDEEDDSTSSPSRKLQKARSRSRSVASSPGKSPSGSRSHSRATSEERMVEDLVLPMSPFPNAESEGDLSARLELARRNSQIQHGRPLPLLPTNPPVEDTIYEGKSFQYGICKLLLNYLQRNRLLPLRCYHQERDRLHPSGLKVRQPEVVRNLNKSRTVHHLVPVGHVQRLHMVNVVLWVQGPLLHYPPRVPDSLDRS